MDRKLIDYLPPVIENIEEIGSIMRAEQPEIDSLTCDIEKAINEKYVSSASIYGIRRWEKILGLTPDSKASLDWRKSIILQHTGLPPTYTLLWLKKRLAAQFGEGNYTLSLDNYIITVTINADSTDDPDAINNLVSSLQLQDVLPVNISICGAVAVPHALLFDVSFDCAHYTPPYCGEPYCGAVYE